VHTLSLAVSEKDFWKSTAEHLPVCFMQMPELRGFFVQRGSVRAPSWVYALLRLNPKLQTVHAVIGNQSSLSLLGQRNTLREVVIWVENYFQDTQVPASGELPRMDLPSLKSLLVADNPRQNSMLSNMDRQQIVRHLGVSALPALEKMDLPAHWFNGQTEPSWNFFFSRHPAVQVSIRSSAQSPLDTDVALPAQVRTLVVLPLFAHTLARLPPAIQTVVIVGGTRDYREIHELLSRILETSIAASQLRTVRFAQIMPDTDQNAAILWREVLGGSVPDLNSERASFCGSMFLFAGAFAKRGVNLLDADGRVLRLEIASAPTA
jgi:hypothetical protein